MNYKFSIASGLQVLQHDLIPSKGGLEDDIAAAGYLPGKSIEIGDPHSYGAGVWQAAHNVDGPKAEYEYLVLVSVGDLGHFVAVPDLPDLVELLTKIGPAAESAAQFGVRELEQFEKGEPEAKAGLPTR